VLSLIVAWILKLLFAAVQAQKARAAAAEGTEDDKTASEGSA
jgi:hypothetical protein